MPRRLVLAGLLVAALSAAAAAEEELLRLKPSDADLSESRRDWYGIYLNGKKIGWLHEDFSREGTGDEAAYVSSSEGLFAVEAMGQQVELQMTEREEFDLAPPHALRAARSESKQGDGDEIVDMRRGPDGFVATISAGGESRTMTVPAPDYTLADLMTQELWTRAGRAAGDTARVRTFDLTELKPDVSTFTVKAVKESLVGGVRTKFYEMTVTTSLRRTESTATVDATGRAILANFGGVFEMRAEPEEQARKLEQGGDLFVFGTARIDKPIGDPARVTKLVVEVEGEGLDKIPAGPRQSVRRAADGQTVTLSLGADAGPTETASAADVAEALAETVEFPTKLPKVVSLAKEAVGDAKTPQEKVERLVHFVSKFIEDDIRAPHVPVAQIIVTRRGDCSEHAQLFVTLARAAGVPAREVGGLMYMGDDVKAFGGHAWNEVVLDGKWVPVDPTWDETTIDATHIALERGGKGMGFVSTLGRLKLRLKDVATAK